MYKYKSLQGAGLEQVQEIVREHRIYCPRPSQLNDPQECKPALTIGDIKNPAYWPKVESWVRRCVMHRSTLPTEEQIQTELRQLTQQRLEGMVAEATQSYQAEIEKKYRILSLSDSLTNQHLWTEYADNYRGVCLAFFVDPFFGSSFEVVYADEAPALDVTVNEGFDPLKFSILVKRLKWQPEREYRLIFQEPPLSEDPTLVDQKYGFPAQRLTSVIFGYQISPDHRRTLMETIRKRVPRLKCFVASPDPTSGDVSIKEDELCRLYRWF